MARLAAVGAAALLVILAWVALAGVLRRRGWPQPPALAGLGPVGGLLALAAAVLLPVVALAVFNSSSGFVWDDLKNLRQAQVEGLSFSYLLEPTSGHFAPGHRLGDWIQFRLFGFEFVPAQVQLLAGFALSLVLFHRILAELFRPGPGAYLLTLGFGLSMVHVGVTQWWASGLDRVPATVLSFLAVWTFLRWHRLRAWPYLAVSVAAVAAGLLFYIKPAFVPVYLVLITLLFLERDLRAALADWWVWLTYAAVTGALAVVYVSRYPVELNRDGGVDVALRYLGILWSRVFVPNLFGLFVPKGDMSPAMVAAAVATQVLLVAVVAATLVRRPGAWRAWAFFAAAFLLNAMVVGLTRVSESTTEILAYTTYFNLEAVFAFFLALAAAVLGGPEEAGEAGERPAASPPAAPIVVGMGVVAYVAMSLWGGWQVSRPEQWIGARSRTILDRAEAGLARLHRSGVDVALVDGVFPDDVVPYLLVPYNSVSEVVPLFDGAASFDAAAGELFSVDRRGRVSPVEFVAEAGGGADALAATDRFGIVGAVATRREPDRICLEAGRDTVTVGLQPPERLDDGGGEGPLALALDFESARPSVLSLVVLPVPVNTESLAGGRDRFRVVNVPGGERQRRVYALDAPEAETVLVVVAPRTELCVYGMEAGHLAPR